MDNLTDSQKFTSVNTYLFLSGCQDYPSTLLDNSCLAVSSTTPRPNTVITRLAHALSPMRKFPPRIMSVLFVMLLFISGCNIEKSTSTGCIDSSLDNRCAIGTLDEDMSSGQSSPGNTLPLTSPSIPTLKDSLASDNPSTGSSSNPDTHSTAPSSTSSSVEYGKLTAQVDLLELYSKLNSLYGEQLSYHQDISHPGFIFGDARRSVSIVKMSESMGSHDDYLRLAGAPGFDIDSTYLNESVLGQLHHPLTDDDSARYKRYLQERVLVQRLEREKSFDLDHGKVLELQVQYVKTDQQGNYKGLYTPSIVLYKVYCSSNYLILLKPRWIEAERTVGGSLDDFKANFEDEVNHLRPSLLIKADEIMKFCPLTYSFFSEMQDIDISRTDTLAYDEQIFLERIIKIDTTASIETADYQAGRLARVKYITLDVINNDVFSVPGEIIVDIFASSDASPERRIISNRKIGKTGLGAEQSIHRQFVPEFDVIYKDNLALRIIIYRDTPQWLIRPTRIEYSRSGDVMSISR